MHIQEAMPGDLEGLNLSAEQDAAKLRLAEQKAVIKEEAPAYIYFDADGNEMPSEEWEKMLHGKGKMKKGKKMKKGEDGKLMLVEEFDADLVKADVLGQGESAFSNASPGSAAVAETTDTGEVSRDEGLPAGYREMQKSVQKFEDGKLVEATAKYLVNDETGDEIFVEYVEKTEEAEETIESPSEMSDMVASLSGPLSLIGKALSKQSDTLDAIREQMAKADDKLEKVLEHKETLIEKQAKLTLVDLGYDLDESLGTLSGHREIAKAESKPDVWAGLCPELDALERKFSGTGE